MYSKLKFVLFILSFLVSTNFKSFSSEIENYFINNSKWLSSSSTRDQKEMVCGFIIYGLEKRFKGENDRVSQDNALPNTGFSVRYDYSTRKALETIHESSLFNKNIPNFKVVDFGSGFGFFTALIPAAIENHKNFTLCFLDGVKENVEQTERAIKYLNTEGAYGHVDCKYMTKLVQLLDSTNYFGSNVNEVADVITCLNVFHFLPERDKLITLSSIYRLLKIEGTVILTFNPFLISNNEIKNGENATETSKYLAEYIIYKNRNNELDTEIEERSLVPAPFQANESFYNQERFYLFEDASWKSLDLNSLQYKMKNMKMNSHLSFFRYVEKTTMSDFKKMLMVVGFKEENITIEEYYFDHLIGTEFERFPKITPPLKSGKSIFVQARK